LSTSGAQAKRSRDSPSDRLLTLIDVFGAQQERIETALARRHLSHVADDQFDKLFVLFRSNAAVSLVKLRYGEPTPPPSTHP
jgi:hypothetical protein